MSVAVTPSGQEPAPRDTQRIYSIAELAREFAVTPRTIRFYEDEGLIKPRRQGTQRLYSVGDRARLGWILRGKRLGFTLAEIKELLDLYHVDRTGLQQMRELLRRSRLHIDDLERRRRRSRRPDRRVQGRRDPGVAPSCSRRGVDPDKRLRKLTEETMAVYKAPLKDIQFVLNEVLDVSQLAKLPGYEDATPDTVHAILEEAAKLCENVLFPLNRTGDEEGCTYENGVVRTPKGFKDAYDSSARAAGRPSPAIPEYGGQGLPATVGFALQEMFTAVEPGVRACIPASATAPTRRCRGTARTSSRRRYLPKLTDGTWAGTMCLTEPQCGTDLGMLRTKRRAAGRRQLRDHRHQDLHLGRRARPHREHRAPRAGAPAGRAGRHQGHLALPRAEVPAQRRTAASASATASAAAPSSTRWASRHRHLRHQLRRRHGLAGGRANKGMRAMFVMMNAARLGVGMQGLGIAETRLPERRRVRAGPPAGPLAHRAEERQRARPTRSSCIPTCGACC